MSRSSFGKIGCALLCSACLGVNAPAQDSAGAQQVPRQDGKAGQPPVAVQSAAQNQNPGHQHHAGHQDNFIASCLVHGNQAEVVLGRLAQEKSQSDAVKKFAGMMVQEHQALLEKLTRFAPNAGELSQNPSESSGRSEAAGGAQRDQDRDNQKPSQQNQGQQNQGTAAGQSSAGQGTQNQDRNNLNAAQHAGQAGDMSMNIAMIEREVAQQCLSDAQAKLSKEEGQKFDKCYMGMQVVAHAQMKSKLTVFSRHASGELKQLIDQGLQTTTKHLEQAESIFKDLDEGADSSRTERRSNDRTSSTEKSEDR